MQRMRLSQQTTQSDAYSLTILTDYAINLIVGTGSQDFSQCLNTEKQT